MTYSRVTLLAALTLPAIVIATQLYVGYRLRGVPVSFGAALVTQLCHWETWALAGPLVWQLARRWPVVPPHRRRALLRHAIAAPIVAAAILTLNLTVYHALVRLPVTAAWFTGFDRSVVSTAAFYVVSYFHVQIVLYGAIVAAAHAVHTTALLRAREHDALQLEAALTGARLTALRMQLQPHFLFNTLHTISSLVMQQQNRHAVQLLAELGDLLRETLTRRETDLAPLRDELAYLRRYLRIEEARFGDRLTVTWDIDPGVLDALVPLFILQPLVENAFRHGISRRADDSRLKIATTSDGGTLVITIYNDGPPVAERFCIETSSGYGLKNVRDRLSARRPAGRLELTNAGAGVCATLRLPSPNAVAPGMTS